MERLSDGTLVFERKEYTPVKVLGYERDPANPKRFTPGFSACRHRRHDGVSWLCCDKMAERYGCRLLGHAVSLAVCQTCPHAEP